MKETRGIGISGKDAHGRLYELVAAHRGQDTNSDGLILKRDGEQIAQLKLRDDIKPSAHKAIRDLKSLGISSVLLSGDSRAACEDVANRIGIEKIYFQKLPQEKLEIVEALEKEQPSAFIGDGINDAAALARVGVGISLSNATDAAIQSSQVVLLNGELDRLSRAVLIARHTLRTIKQNLFWAFFYNILAIPIAAAGYLSPIVAALAMAFSDVIVIGNSLRLKVRDI